MRRSSRRTIPHRAIQLRLTPPQVRYLERPRLLTRLPHTQERVLRLFVSLSMFLGMSSRYGFRRGTKCIEAVVVKEKRTLT